ncbi:MAG: magnesium chelatase subunit D [Devosiaceae bacterium]
MDLAVPSDGAGVLGNGGLTAEAKAQIWADALTAMSLVALDPVGFGGSVVRAHAGPVRDALVAALHGLVPTDMPVRKMPSHIADERLLGGLDMAATLSAGKPVTQRGLLSEANGGVILIPMAERMEALTASRLTAVLDTGEVSLERDGITASLRAKLGIVALDEGIGEETVSTALSDRMAFRAVLTDLSIRDMAQAPLRKSDIENARPLLAHGTPNEHLFEVMTALAAAFGVSSVRAILFAIRTARGLAALDGRTDVEDQDIEMAARLVISPRATRLPLQEDEEDVQPEESPPEPQQPEEAQEQSEVENDDPPPPDGPLDDQVLDAVEAAIPAHLLEQLKLGAAMAKSSAQSAGGKGVQQQALMRGRPIGSRRGRLDGRSKLHVVDTLRAAAPWQPLRRQSGSASRISVTGEDIRVRRFKQNEESVTIFLVDASGSAALHRLAEVKGAVELLLAESYARRDYVSLIVFRGQVADMVLPPTRSLVRAQRCLARVPGGGGTPLAAGLDAGLDVALECQRQGKSPRLVVMSDAQANVGYDPASGRAGARDDALAAARRIGASGIAGLFIDTSPQRGSKRTAERSKAVEIAQAMQAVHLALPYPNAAGLRDLVEGGKPQKRAG